MKSFYNQTIFCFLSVFLALNPHVIHADGFWDDDDDEDEDVQLWDDDVSQSSSAPKDSAHEAEEPSSLVDLRKCKEDAEQRKEAVLEESNGKIKAEKPVVWTDSDTEWLWSQIVDSATSTSTRPRFSEADANGGEGLLESFGTQFLPNAYAYYQEVREVAKEREQLFRENFPDGRSSDTTGGALYDKVQKATAKAIAEMFRRHDELCYYLLLFRMGSVSDQELADLDSSRIAVVLPEEAKPPAVYERSAPVLATAELDFATKYLPETQAAFQRLDNAFSEGVKSYGDWRKMALLVDATRSDALFQSLRARLDGICDHMDGIVRMVKEKKLLHAVGEVSASDLAKFDRNMGLSVQQFEKGIPVGSVVNAQIRGVIRKLQQPRLTIKGLVANMLIIPERRFLMGKYEVTQEQWKTVMGNNPSEFKALNNPVENVSWYDCQRFLEKLNAHSVVKESDLTFRLPTKEEWQFACRAGATGGYCRLEDGTEITEKTLGQVAWFAGNAGGTTHPVGKKKPNAWGLYDMHGNVWEWTSTKQGWNGEGRLSLGCSWVNDNWRDTFKSSKEWTGSDPFNRNNATGFRLCATPTKSTMKTSNRHKSAVEEYGDFADMFE